MKLKEFLEFFCGELYLRKKDNVYQIVDRYHEDNKDYDYGVFVQNENLDELLKHPIHLIPDIHYENEIDFLLRDDFPNHYGMSEETIRHIESKINKKGFDHCDTFCKELGENEAYNDLKSICRVLREEEPLEL